MTTYDFFYMLLLEPNLWFLYFIFMPLKSHCQELQIWYLRRKLVQVRAEYREEFGHDFVSKRETE